MSYKFFENKDCEFYPCHQMKKQNCLFCYCPLYQLECWDKSKDCMHCKYPHLEANYENIIKSLKKNLKRT